MGVWSRNVNPCPGPWAEIATNTYPKTKTQTQAAFEIVDCAGQENLSTKSLMAYKNLPARRRSCFLPGHLTQPSCAPVWIVPLPSLPPSPPFSFVGFPFLLQLACNPPGPSWHPTSRK